MSRIILALGCIICAAVAGNLFAADPETPTDLARENARLKARVAELEAQVQSLRQQLQREAPSLPRRYFQLTPQPMLPPGAVPRQFNGMTYYMVPLGGEVRMSLPDVMPYKPAADPRIAPVQP